MYRAIGRENGLTDVPWLENQGIEGIQKGKYLLHQLTVELDYVGSCHLDEKNGEQSYEHSSRIKLQKTDPVNDSPASIGNSLSNRACPLALVSVLIFNLGIVL